MQFSPACERNKEPIVAVLGTLLNAGNRVLEVGSGTGQHAAWFASALPEVTWQPSDRPGHLQSIEAWRAQAGAPNLLSAVEVDLLAGTPWPVSEVDAVVAINVAHIVSFEGVRRLVSGAARILTPGGLLFLYGPFRFADRPLEPSNEAFDQSLRARDPASGIRLFDDIDAEAAANGLHFGGERPMPAHNRSLWWRRAEA
jgi:SAM-dependent methyltransferase